MLFSVLQVAVLGSTYASAPEAAPLREVAEARGSAAWRCSWAARGTCCLRRPANAEVGGAAPSSAPAEAARSVVRCTAAVWSGWGRTRPAVAICPWRLPISAPARPVIGAKANGGSSCCAPCSLVYRLLPTS